MAVCVILFCQRLRTRPVICHRISFYAVTADLYKIQVRLLIVFSINKGSLFNQESGILILFWIFPAAQTPPRVTQHCKSDRFKVQCNKQ